MIISCEKCDTRFKVADEKISADGVKVRCSKCSHVFTVHRAAEDTKAGPGGIFAAPQDGPASGDPFGPKPTVPTTGATAPGFDPFQAPKPGAMEEQATAVRAMFPEGQSGSGPIVSASSDPFAAAPAATPPPTPPAPAPPSSDPFAAAPSPPPSPAPAASDPFGAPAGAAGAADPFGAPAAGAADPFGAAAAASSAQVGSPPSGDPFAAPSAGGAADPFGGSDDGPRSSAPVTDDPFDPDQASPFADGAVAASDPFAALGLEPDPDDGYQMDDAPMPAAPPPPSPLDAPAEDNRGAFGYQAETRVHEVDEELRRKSAGEEAKAARGRSLVLPAKIGGMVLRAAWVVVQAVLLAGFLTLAIVYARGGDVADVIEGRATDVVLGRIATAGDTNAPLRAEEVSVARRVTGMGENVVVVSGSIVNDGDADAPAVRVKVTFGDSGTFHGWAGTQMSGVDLATADEEGELSRLVARTPHEPAVPVGSPKRFYVLARGVADGLKASVSVEVAEPPPPPAPEPTAAAAGDEPSAEPTPPPTKKRRKRRAADASSAKPAPAGAPAPTSGG